MKKKSAGLLMYRRRGGRLNVFLVHPGGPFWAKKDLGSWSLPKGEFADNEDALEAAKREFQEETGLTANGKFAPLTPRKQPGGRMIHAWMFEGDCDASSIRSNSFSMEWPPRSGKVQQFPEIDRAEWFSLDAAKEKILKGQLPFLEELEEHREDHATEGTEFSERAYRIISLLPSATEIVCALGFEDRLVGRSHECDYPPSVKRLRPCTRPKFDVQGTSQEIDRRVRSIVQNALSVYDVDTGALKELRPTHIVTQSQCEVCAVNLKDVEQAVCELTAFRPVIVSLKPDSLTDLWEDIRKVGSALGASPRAEELLRCSHARMQEVADRARGLQSRPTVACIEWMDPLMAAGNWMPELVAIAGGTNLLGQAGKHSGWVTWEDLVGHDPDIIFVSPCGFPIDRTLQEMRLLSDRPEWNRLQAVRTDRVFIADGNQYFNRPGPRIVESLEILAEMLHPNVFHFGHEGHGWVRLDRINPRT